MAFAVFSAVAAAVAAAECVWHWRHASEAGAV